MASRWYVRTSKADRGPYDAQKLRRLAESGKIKPGTLVSRDKEKWIEASTIRGLEFAGSKRRPQRPVDEKPDDESEAATHVPWYEGQSSARKAQAFASMETAALRESMPSNAQYFVDRVKYSGITAGLAAGLTYGIVRLCYIFGVLAATSATSTLSWRIGLPSAVFIIIFALLFWSSGRSGPSGPITDDMTDEEIARML